MLGHDGGPGGDDAAALAGLLAGADGEVHAVIAIPYPPRRVGEPPIEPEPGPGNWEQIKSDLEAKATDVLERRALSRVHAAKSFGEVLIDNSAPAALTAIGEAERPDCIVVGSSRRGRLGAVLIGSTGEKLAHGSAAPVAIAPRGYSDAAPERIATVAVGFDGGGEADHALELAASIARRHGASLRVIGVLETTIGEGEIIAEAYDALSGKPVVDRRKHELETRMSESIAAHAEDLGRHRRDRARARRRPPDRLLRPGRRPARRRLARLRPARPRPARQHVLPPRRQGAVSAADRDAAQPLDPAGPARRLAASRAR